MQCIKNMSAGLTSRVIMTLQKSPYVRFVVLLIFMTFGVFSPAGCSSKDATTPDLSDLACPAGTARLADASKKTLETCMASLPPDLACPAGTARLADASKKTLETCMASLPPDLACPVDTARLAGASTKTLETCMASLPPDLACPVDTARLAGASTKTIDTCTIDTKIDTDGDDTPDFIDVDDDGDGLIEINSLLMLHNIRYNLDGTGFKAPDDNRDATGDKTGCGKTGSVVCNGYELTQDLSFDKDGDGNTWTVPPPSPDSNNVGYTLDPDDSASPYFIVADGGWKPIGEGAVGSNSAIICNNLCFNAIFEGNGHTITGLAISREERFIGMFGSTTTNAVIRNIGLIKNLTNCTRTSDGNSIGGLVGYQQGGSITASYTTGDVNGGEMGRIM